MRPLTNNTRRPVGMMWAWGLLALTIMTVPAEARAYMGWCSAAGQARFICLGPDDAFYGFTVSGKRLKKTWKVAATEHRSLKLQYSDPLREEVLGQPSADWTENGDTLLAWVTSLSSPDRLHQLRIDGSGKIEHEVVLPPTTDENQVFVMDVRGQILSRNSSALIYIDWSEEYFRPISDTGSAPKLHLIIIRDDEKQHLQLMPKGFYRVEAFDAANGAGDDFWVAWIERDVGLFRSFLNRMFGRDRRLIIAKVAHDLNEAEIRVEKRIEVPFEESDPSLRTKVMIYPSNSPGKPFVVTQTDLARSEFYGSVLRKFSLEGHKLAEYKIDGIVDDLVFAPEMGMYRYTTRPPIAEKTDVEQVIVHWTDFSGYAEEVPIVLSAGDEIPKQPPGRCFEWLSVRGGRLVVEKVCREEGRSQ